MGSKIIGLVDLKGTGIMSARLAENQETDFNAMKGLESSEMKDNLLKYLRTKDHSDGMGSLGEMIAEVTRQKAIQDSFELYNATHNTGFQTVENYFIIDEYQGHPLNINN